MAKKLVLFSLRLLMLNVVADIIVAMVFYAIQNEIAQICIDAFFVLVLWYFVWRDAMNIGLKDSQKDKISNQSKAEENNDAQRRKNAFVPWFGFAAGFISQIPTFVLAVVLVFLNQDGVLNTVLKLVINLLNFYVLYIQNSMRALFPFVFVIASVLFCVVSGLAYLSGPREMKRIETIIERNLARGARRVQDEWKAEKKRKKHGNRR